MRKNIQKVLNAFDAGKSAHGDSKRTCSTDGETIYSYSTAIARKLPGGAIWLTSASYSRTSNSQRSAIRLHARLSGIKVIESEFPPKEKNLKN